MIFRVLGGGIPKTAWIRQPTFTSHNGGGGGGGPYGLVEEGSALTGVGWSLTIPRIACNVDHRAWPCTTIILTQKKKRTFPASRPDYFSRNRDSSAGKNQDPPNHLISSW